MSSGPSTPAGSHLDDEQLSLIIDGVGDPESVAHTERCRDCGERAARWRQVRDLVAGPPAAASGERRDAAVEAALEVFDNGAERSEPARVIDLAGPRRHRIGRSRTVAAVGASAAALLVVAGLGFGLSRIGPDHASTAASSSGPESKSTATQRSASESRPEAAAPAPPAVALGSFPDMAALIPALHARMGEVPAGASSAASNSASEPSSEAPVPRCRPAASAAAGVAPATEPELVATLTYAGAPAVVYLYRAPASHVAVVLGATSCRVLAQGSL